MSQLLQGMQRGGAPRSALQAVRRELDAVLHGQLQRYMKGRRQPLTPDDDAEILRNFDEARGYHLTRKERSKRAHELAQGAPTIRTTVNHAHSHSRG